MHEVTGLNGGPIEMVEVSRLSDAQLTALGAGAFVVFRLQSDRRIDDGRSPGKSLACRPGRAPGCGEPDAVRHGTAARTQPSRWTRSRFPFASGAGPSQCSSTRTTASSPAMPAPWRRSSSGLAEIPVMVAAGWSEAQKRAYVIADNKLALNAGWDEALLKIELSRAAGARLRPRHDRLLA